MKTLIMATVVLAALGCSKKEEGAAKTGEAEKPAAAKKGTYGCKVMNNCVEWRGTMEEAKAKSECAANKGEFVPKCPTEKLVGICNQHAGHAVMSQFTFYYEPMKVETVKAMCTGSHKFIAP